MKKTAPPPPPAPNVPPETELPEVGPFFTITKRPNGKGYVVLEIFTQGRNVVSEKVLSDENGVNRFEALDIFRAHAWNKLLGSK